MAQPDGGIRVLLRPSLHVRTEHREAWQTMADDLGINSGTEKITCAACGREKVVDYLAGPKHGGWNVRFDLNGVKCGETLGTFRAYRQLSVQLLRRKRL